MPQIGRHGLETDENFEAGLINLLLQLVNFLVVVDSVFAKTIIPLKQPVDRAMEAALGSARHREQIFAEIAQRFIECLKDMLR